jgi:hypothetical protein
MTKVYAVIAFVLTVVIAGCSDDPSDLGHGLLLPSDTLNVGKSEFTSTSDTTVVVKGNDNLGRIFVGRYPVTSLEAASILQFTVSTFTATQIIDSARIILTRNYSYLDSTGPYAINAYYVSQSWTTSTFTWDSLTAKISDTLAGSTVVASTLGDSTISVPIDTAIVNLWSIGGGGSVALTSPSNVLGMNIIVGYANYADLSGDYRPLLRISYHEAADTTLQTNIRSTRAISVVNGPAPVPGTMILQASLASRSVLRFDTFSLPKHASVTQASLWLPADPTQTALNNYSRDSVVVYMLRDNVYPYDSTAYSTLCSPVDSNGQKYYRGDVRNIIQYWNTHTFNLGLILHPYGEYTTMDRFSLFGSASSTARPLLKVTYSVLP